MKRKNLIARKKARHSLSEPPAAAMAKLLYLILLKTVDLNFL